jgi:hypothetical protein
MQMQIQKPQYIRATAGFFVRDRGIVNPGETVEVTAAEAFDIVGANRGELIERADFAAGPQADFKPKYPDGKVIPPDIRTREQRRAAARAQAARLV